MGDLKRYRHGARKGVMTPDPDGSFVRYEEAAAALEAAREDAERFTWWFTRTDESSGSLVDLHIRAISGDHPTLCEWRAAIDQARGKGCGAGKGGSDRES